MAQKLNWGGFFSTLGSGLAQDALLRMQREQELADRAEAERARRAWYDMSRRDELADVQSKRDFEYPVTDPGQYGVEFDPVGAQGPTPWRPSRGTLDQLMLERSRPARQPGYMPFDEFARREDYRASKRGKGGGGAGTSAKEPKVKFGAEQLNPDTGEWEPVRLSAADIKAGQEIGQVRVSTMPQAQAEPLPPSQTGNLMQNVTGANIVSPAQVSLMDVVGLTPSYVAAVADSMAANPGLSDIQVAGGALGDVMAGLKVYDNPLTAEDEAQILLSGIEQYIAGKRAKDNKYVLTMKDLESALNKVKKDNKNTAFGHDISIGEFMAALARGKRGADRAASLDDAAAFGQLFGQGR